ncbi:MAG: DUF554 domain-containing protein [Ardenticatenia bacterium]|nr:DUF554 domain-containing protein [Ardenticatenia bacterium]
MTGTLINVVTVLVGGTTGLVLGHRLSEQARQTLLGGVGLVTVVVGVQMALTTRSILIVLFSVLLGGLIGEWWQLEARLEALGDWLQRRLSRGEGPSNRVTEGFITASLVFCVGPMTILGAIQDGLLGDYRLLAIKSVLDGFTAMAFAAALGWGVLLSVITLLVYQGGISLSAMILAGAWATNVGRDVPAIVELTATGGVLIIGIGLLLLDIKRLPVANYLPAIGIAPLLVVVLQRLGVG